MSHAHHKPVTTELNLTSLSDVFSLSSVS